MEAVDTTAAVAYCGLYCATCGCSRVGVCTGCKLGGGFARCPVRLCSVSQGFATCAECRDVETCGKLNNLVSKLYDLICRSHRRDNLREIRTAGLDAFLASRAK